MVDVLSLYILWIILIDKMVDVEFILKFKKFFWFLNIVCGKSVVIKDLVLVLKSGKILGVGLDVLEYEKLFFELLFILEMFKDLKVFIEMENVIFMLYVVGWIKESKEKLV